MDPGFSDEFSPMQGRGPAEEEAAAAAAAADAAGSGAAAAENVNGSGDGSSSSPLRSSGGSSSGGGGGGERREEPEVIKKWKEQQVKHLEEKDRLEEEAKVALRERAKKELADWYSQHSEQLAKLQATNRAASETSEKELEELGAPDIRPGTEWERVARLCDFNPKAARNVKDISRLRSVILQLKQGGPCTSVMQQQSSSAT